MPTADDNHPGQRDEVAATSPACRAGPPSLGLPRRNDPVLAAKVPKAEQMPVPYASGVLPWAEVSALLADVDVDRVVPGAIALLLTAAMRSSGMRTLGGNTSPSRNANRSGASVCGSRSWLGCHGCRLAFRQDRIEGPMAWLTH